MAQEVLATVLHRLGVDPEPVAVDLVQYELRREPGAPAVETARWLPAVRRVTRGDRPPLRSLRQLLDGEISVTRGTILS